jgi:hypothetical protein
VIRAAPTEVAASQRLLGLPDKRYAITRVLVSSKTELGGCPVARRSL